MPEAATRKSPFELPYPLAMRYTFEVEFPTSVSATVDPGKQEFLQPGLLMKHWTSFRGNRATMALDLAVLKPSIPPEDVRKYMEAVLWLRRVSRDGFWAAKATTPASTAAAATSATFRERQEQFVKARIERMNKTLQDGKLQGDDLANAYCTRAMANASLRSFDQAAQDVDRAVQASPDAPFIQYCRGATLARSGRIKDAIAAYGQAIVLDPSYAPAYAARGVARVNASQFEAALADFAGFERADPARKRYAQLWTAFAMRRLGKEPDAAGKADAKSAASDAWPAPALAMMYDLLTPDEVLTKANALKGDERELMLVEAYHAIAQWHLARGEKAEAAAYFRKTADIGALNYYEHDSSLRELKALGQSQ
jgi:lipoprotein NlpI